MIRAVIQAPLPIKQSVTDGREGLLPTCHASVQGYERRAGEYAMPTTHFARLRCGTGRGFSVIARSLSIGRASMRPGSYFLYFEVGIYSNEICTNIMQGEVLRRVRYVYDGRRIHLT